MCPRYRLRPRRPLPRGSYSLATMTSGSAALGHVRDRVDHALQAFLGQQHEVLLAAGGPDLLPGAESIAGLLAGGKRLRPAFCYWGWRGAGGPDCPEIFQAAASLELLHAGALIHDDLMDASDTRRGQPSLHRQFEVRHARARWHGSAAAFGMGAAILMGDLLLCWTDEMFHASGRSPMRMAAPMPNAAAEPCQRPRACRTSNCRCRAGWPRRVSLASMRSSWMSAPACSNSSDAAAWKISGQSGPPAPRQPQ